MDNVLVDFESGISQLENNIRSEYEGNLIEPVILISHL